MDPRTKAFLEAVAGVHGAYALIKGTKQIPGLEGLIAPKAIMTWLDVAQDTEFDGQVPGTDIPLSFSKSESGYAGRIELAGQTYDFAGRDINHLAAAIAVGIGAQTETDIDHKTLPKLSKSIEVLVKVEVLNKTSWNVKARRQFQFAHGADKPNVYDGYGKKNIPVHLTADQVSDRRAQYARSIGLNPQYGVGKGVFPVSEEGNNLRYNGDFDIAHEIGHAAMTPEGKSLGDYQKWLSDPARADGPSSDTPTDDMEDALLDRDEGLHHENVANTIEHHVDRRAGLDPHAFQSIYRNTLRTAHDQDNEDNGQYDPKSNEVVSNPRPGKLNANAASPKLAIPAEHLREEAQGHIKQFDEGAKFNETGHIVKPQGVDAKINTRAKLKLPGQHLFGKAEPDMTKAQQAPKQGGGGHKAPGPAASPQAPMLPTAPVLVQPANAKPQVGTQVKDTKTTAKAPAKTPGAAATSAPKLPGMKVTKAEAQTPCPACKALHFKENKYSGCICMESLAKSVTTKATSTGYSLIFDSEWGDEEISTLAELLGKF